MKPKFTPGPWTVTRTGATDIYKIESNISDRKHSSTEERVATATVLNEANARLIAAAPELKSSAEIALDLMETVEWNDDDIQPEWDNCLKLLRDAIAKATGGAE